MSNGEPPILGIDLGTSTCLAGAVRDGRPVLVRPDRAFPQPDPDDLQYPGVMLPSAFCFRDGKVVVGHRALELIYAEPPGDVVTQVKRQMHRDASEPSIRSGGRLLRPSQIAGYYVKALVRAAEREFGLPARSIDRAVVTVPTHFGATERKATERACVEYGGLSKVWFVDEPVAAAYSMELHRHPGAQRVLIVDLGGGTLDVTLLRVGQGVAPNGFEELSRDGESNLGGLDWDREIATWAVLKAMPDASVEEFDRLLEGPGFEHASLFERSEYAKINFFGHVTPEALSRPSFAPPRLLVQFEKAKRPFSVEMPGEAFLHETERLVEGCVAVCERLFHDYAARIGVRRFGWEDVDKIVLAGGGSHMATIRHRFAQRWGREPEIDEFPQQAVVKGAALCAWELQQGHDISHVVGKARYPHTVGISYSDGAGRRGFHPLIQRNTEVPFRRSYFFRPNGDPSQNFLRVPIVEQQLDRNGHREQAIETVILDSLPPPQPGSEDLIEITADCDDNGMLSFTIAFRQRDLQYAVDDRRRQARVADGVAGNGTPG